MGNDVFHVDELLTFGLKQFAHGDPGPGFDDLCDFGGTNLFGDHGFCRIGVLLLGFNLFFLFANLAFDLGNIAVLEASSLIETTRADCKFKLGAQFIQLHAKLADAIMSSLLRFPATGESRQLLILVR